MNIADSIVGIALAVGLVTIWYNLERAFGGVGLIAGLVIISIVMIALDNGSSDCYVEWDGRSNPMVCE
jgi:hypothetical protein